MALATVQPWECAHSRALVPGRRLFPAKCPVCHSPLANGIVLLDAEGLRLHIGDRQPHGRWVTLEAL